MRSLVFVLLLALMVLIQSCTGQSPAELKKRSTFKSPIKQSCSSMIFEGQVFSKKNILSIFDCSGWAKTYPVFTKAIQGFDEKAFNNSFKILNDSFFVTKSSRKRFYEIVAEAEARGEMESLGNFLEKQFSKNKILTFLDKTLSEDRLSQEDKSNLFHFLSASNEENLKTIQTFKNLLSSFEKNKPQFMNSLSDEEKAHLIDRIIIATDELTSKMSQNDWRQISKVFAGESSSLKEWAGGGIEEGSENLVEILVKSDFSQNVNYLKRSLDDGIKCHNKANASDFFINVKNELSYKIDSLKNDEKEIFEKTLLHGLSKYIAFTEFCEEKNSRQGLDSLYRILKDAFTLIETTHDYEFLKSIHRILGNERFKFINFLTSKTFEEIRQVIIGAKDNGLEGELMNSLLSTAANLDLDGYKQLASLLSSMGEENSATRNWYKSFVKYWGTLSQEEKINLVSILGVFVDEDFNSSKTLSFFNEVFKIFPEFSPLHFAALSDLSYQSGLSNIIEALSSSEAQEELSLFFSNRGLFEVISIMTQEYEGKSQLMPQLSTKLEQTPAQFIQRPEALKTSQTRICFKELTSAYERETNYYSLVHSLPPSCLISLGEAGFVGRIYLWMNTADGFLQNNYQINDFNSAAGVWSPGMLHFIFSSALKADSVLLDGKNKGISKNLDEIHRVLSDDRVLKTIHDFSNLYEFLEKELAMDKRLFQFASKTSDKELNLLLSDSLSLFETKKSKVNVSISRGDCLDLSKKLGTDPCLTPQQSTAGILDLMRILRRKNEDGNSLIKELIKWVHPQSGIALPDNRRHVTSMDEIVRFLNDLSSEKTNKAVIYSDNNEVHHIAGSILERVEVVIRDISFLDNFYGAYFKNNVANSRNYKDEIIDSEKLLVLMDHTGRVLRGTGIFPKDTKLKLKNVRSSYLSLADLAGSFPQADGSKRSYDDFIQSLLMAIKNSSKKSTQDFNPYRNPDSRIVEGHNGVFLTKVVKMSGLRHMANFVHKRFDPKLSTLQNDLFKKINSRLIGRHQVVGLQDFAQKMLDQYLDNDRNQLNLLTADLISYISKMDNEDQENFESSIVKILAILSDENLSKSNTWALIESSELIIKFWPEIREVLIKIDSGKKLMSLLNDFLNGFLASPEKLDHLMTKNSELPLMNQNDLAQLINQPPFANRMSILLNDLIELRDLQTNLNVVETLKAVLGSTENEWAPLKSWLLTTFDSPSNRLTLTNLIKIVGQKDVNGYRLKLILDEVFLNHRKDLEKFLAETFKSIEIIVD